MEFRPHIMTWNLPGESTTEPGTGYEIPGVPGITKAVECRFYLGGLKEFKNEDNKVVQQKGKIRVDAGSELPLVGSKVKVYEVAELLSGDSVLTVNGATIFVTGPVHFEGRIMDIYRGQLTWRLDV
jgi:hypothetical protein